LGNIIIHPQINYTMGKGDKKSRRGKLFQGSYGVLRRRKSVKTVSTAAPLDNKSKETSEIKEVKEVIGVKEVKAVKEVKEVKAVKEVKEVKAVKEVKEVKEPKEMKATTPAKATKATTPKATTAAKKETKTKKQADSAS